MKQFILLGIVILCAFSTQAQVGGNNSSHPQKLDDIIKAYRNANPVVGGVDEDETDEGRERSEGKNYQFERWVAYWRMHLDENGYLVSPAKTMLEWNNYQNKLKARPLNKTTNTTNESQWTFIGPSQSAGGYNGIGRTQVIGFHPTDPNTFVVGSGCGGAWRTTDGGLTWTSLYDNLPVLGVSDVDYNPQNPNTIFISTGDRDPGGPLFTYDYSVGLYKSTDGGSTWNPTGLQYSVTAQKKINALIINPIDTNSMIAATNYGMLKSVDGGTTWAQTSSVGFMEVKYCPTDTSIVFGAGYNGGSFNMYRSTNGGATWTQVTSLAGSSRISFSVTSQTPAIVKFISANTSDALQGIYSSSDTGKTYTLKYGNGNCNTNLLSSSSNLNSNSCTGQGSYDLCIAINPIDSNKVVVGGVNTYMSSNGGTTWQLVTQWAGGSPGIKTVHADKHYQIYNPLDPTTLYECNDGGIYKTTNPASTSWTDLTNGMGISNFYRLAVADAANFVIGGCQDDGSKKLSLTGTSTELTGGDGQDCQIDYTNPNTFYTSSQYGSISRTTNGGSNFSTISNNITGQPQGGWTSPILINPLINTTILAGLDHVYASTNQGSSWTDLTPTLTNTTINRITMSLSDPNMIYYQFGSSSIKYSPDFGVTWNTPTLGYSGTISDILADPKDKNLLWVTYGGFTSAKVTNYRVGGSWTAYKDSLPNIPIECITIDSANGTKYIGTDVGVFYRDSSMTGWALYNTGLPTVLVSDIHINYATNEVWASTYGRGIWKSPKHMTTPNINSISNIPFAFDVIKVAPNPNNGEFKIMTTNSELIGQKVNVHIISFLGSSVMNLDNTFDGSGGLNVNATNLARGTYMVEVYKGNMLFARTKMVVL